MKVTVALALSLATSASCLGLPTPQSTERQAADGPAASVAQAVSAIQAVSVVQAASATAAPTAPAPAAYLPVPVSTRSIVPVSTGSHVPVSTRSTVGPLREGAPPCFADRYPCETIDFSLAQEGSIEVTLTWEGPPRALMVQLYWAGAGLAHEDVAPRDGPSRIWFRRPRMEAADYTLRVVSLEPNDTIPFTLALTR